MNKLVILIDEGGTEALEEAFNIVEDSEFELINTYNFNSAEEQILDFSVNTKWIIIDQVKFFAIATRLLRDGLKTRDGQVVGVNVVFISK